MPDASSEHNIVKGRHRKSEKYDPLLLKIRSHYRKVKQGTYAALVELGKVRDGNPIPRMMFADQARLSYLRFNYKNQTVTKFRERWTVGRSSNVLIPVAKQGKMIRSAPKKPRRETCHIQPKERQSTTKRVRKPWIPIWSERTSIQAQIRVLLLLTRRVTKSIYTRIHYSLKRTFPHSHRV